MRFVVRGAACAVSFALLALAGGCASTSSEGSKTLNYTDDAKRAYDEALAAYHDKDYESARPLFEEMKKLYPQSVYARLAELRLADIDFAQGKYQDAISSYRGYVSTYRTDREVEYARYRLAKALFFDIDDTILLPPAEERDQGTTADAYRELRAFLRAYPHSRYKKDVDYMLEVVTERLVRHELYVARYYRRKDNYDAAVGRLDYALRTYAGSGLDAEALILKGETLMMLNRSLRGEARLPVGHRRLGWAVRAACARLPEVRSPIRRRSRQRSNAPPIRACRRKSGDKNDGSLNGGKPPATPPDVKAPPKRN